MLSDLLGVGAGNLVELFAFFGRGRPHDDFLTISRFGHHHADHVVVAAWTR
ncbi:hypothetical protein D3C87_1946660 [compost metagenome]